MANGWEPSRTNARIRRSRWQRIVGEIGREDKGALANKLDDRAQPLVPDAGSNTEPVAEAIVDSSKPSFRKNLALALPTEWVSERRYLASFPGSTSARSAGGSLILAVNSRAFPAASHDQLQGLKLPQVLRKGYGRDKASGASRLSSSAILPHRRNSRVPHYRKDGSRRRAEWGLAVLRSGSAPYRKAVGNGDGWFTAGGGPQGDRCNSPGHTRLPTRATG